MFGTFERAVAFRYLRARRGERFVSVIAAFSLIGIALGVATLIIVMSVMNGFRQELLSRILGLNGDLGVYGAGTSITDYQGVVKIIRGVPGVVSAAPIVEGQALLSNDHGAAIGGLIRGIRQGDLESLTSVSRHVIAGSLNAFTGTDVAAIGSGVARSLDLRIGDQITLVSPQGATTVLGTIPRILSYRVAAIFQVGMNEYDSTFVFLPLEAAQLFFQKPDAATQIQVTLTNPDAVGAVEPRIIHALAGRPLRILDWQHANDSFFAAVTVERNVMFLILTLIILVAAFNIVSSLIMMVKDKTADIAVLRTIGASRGAVMRIFLICGASVGIVGTVAGTVIGVLFCQHIDAIKQWLQGLTGTDLFNPEVYYLEQLPAVLDWHEVIRVIVMALVLAFLATIYPSWRAARTDPVEALRHE
ncbi:MAG: lipoprotein-releasing ABC transporter permease subunit [Acetobacteraceae bacterium]